MNEELYKIHKRSHKNWVNDLGDKILRLSYDNIRTNSIVFDLGGYLGDWTENIVNRYDCHVHVFEPVNAFAHNIRTRFTTNPKVHVHQIALGRGTKDVYFQLDGDASKIIQEESNEHIEQIDIRQFLFSFFQNIDRATFDDYIDLMKINVEGTEYEIIPALVESGLIKQIKQVQVQFHWFIEGADENLAICREMLSRTHRPTYIYDYVWENWELI